MTPAPSPADDLPAHDLAAHDLARRVRLFLQQRRAARGRLIIEAENGIVTLRGTLATYHERQLVVSTAQRVARVLQIIDELAVHQVPELRKPLPSTSKSTSALSAASAILVAVMFVGCGRTEPARVATVPARGTISFQGQPIAGAFVALHPKTPRDFEAPTATAVVQPDGRFAVTTYDAGDGAPEGDYVVTVQWRKATKSGGEFVPGPNLLPAKFSQPETSDLKVHIAAGVAELPPITLKR
jgi:hypothetical protein